jgi:hypothetical protein
VNISLDNCLGKWSQAPLVRGSSLVGTNYCPGPLVTGFPPYTGDPPQTDPVSCGDLCSYTQICVNGVCEEDPYWRER